MGGKPWARLGLGVAAIASCASAETGDILVEYDSAWGRLPTHFGWQLDRACPDANCPAGEGGLECLYQGGRDAAPADGLPDNNCASGTGCRREDEAYNAPPELAAEGTCSFTEWAAFDDGEDWPEGPYPAALPRRNLTIADANWGPRTIPPFGAPGFAGAPRHATLRLSTGGGVPDFTALPATAGNLRNYGRIGFWHGVHPPPELDAVTLVARMAAGNRRRQHEMVQLRAFGRGFSVGVDGEIDSATLGRFGGGHYEARPHLLFGTATVQVALARPRVPGPPAGEFFLLRLTIRRDGSITAWLNDDPATIWTGLAGSDATVPDRLRFVPDLCEGTMWLDFARLLEGEVPPGFIGCNSPPADTDHDHEVDAADFANGLNGFSDCATGPAPAASVMIGLPPDCRCLDVNDDRAIDQADYAAFQRCWSAATPAADADPACLEPGRR